MRQGFGILGDVAFRGLANIKGAKNYQRVDQTYPRILKTEIILENPIMLLKSKVKRLDHTTRIGETRKYIWTLSYV